MKRIPVQSTEDEPVLLTEVVSEAKQFSTHDADEDLMPVEVFRSLYRDRIV